MQSLRERGADHVKVVGGGGGVIVHDEITRLRESGVTIFSPEDGQRMGLVGMINSVIESCDVDLWEARQVGADQVLSGDRFAVARAITGAEQGRLPDDVLAAVREAAGRATTPVLGITGTGARASRPSPTSWCGGSASTSTTSCASRWSRSTRRGARAAARCSATGSA